jgi:hypothetical protein
MGRPPIADRRRRRLPDGRFALELRHRWSDGTSHILLSGTELCERLAALVPPPRIHQVRYCGGREVELQAQMLKSGEGFRGVRSCAA